MGIVEVEILQWTSHVRLVGPRAEASQEAQYGKVLTGDVSVNSQLRDVAVVARDARYFIMYNTIGMPRLIGLFAHRKSEHTA